MSKKFNEALEDYNKVIELDPKNTMPYGNRAIVYSVMGNYREAAENFKKAGILFLKSGKTKDSIRALSMCFDLRQKIEDDYIIYCGLMLYFLTSDENIITDLKKMDVRDDKLRKLFELTVKKVGGKDISRSMDELKGNGDSLIYGMLENHEP